MMSKMPLSFENLKSFAQYPGTVTVAERNSLPDQNSLSGLGLGDSGVSRFHHCTSLRVHTHSNSYPLAMNVMQACIIGSIKDSQIKTS